MANGTLMAIVVWALRYIEKAFSFDGKNKATLKLKAKKGSFDGKNKLKRHFEGKKKGPFDWQGALLVAKAARVEGILYLEHWLQGKGPSKAKGKVLRRQSPRDREGKGTLKAKSLPFDRKGPESKGKVSSKL